MNEKLEKFKELLREIFEMDKSDLDFGIYRIINLRKDKIEDFIDNKLPNEISNILNTTGDANKIEELASDVYSALYNFFNRYYDDGDFISKRRYKEGVYAIPYEGEEVKLYWANYDQYYIKTSEDFKDYEFKTNDGITCKFKLIDVTTEQNNNKEKDNEKRNFMLYKKGDSDDETIETFSYDKDNKIFTICFIYDIPENKDVHVKSEDLEKDIKEWIESNAQDIAISILAPQNTTDKKSKTLLKKHLDAYIAKNKFDYFIHKDLKKYLDRELDFYIKTEIMHLDDLNTENERQLDQYILKVKAIKKVGQVIIDFLASVENFQKKLWLKKKFIIETNWCITLDKIKDEFYDEIRNNKEQVNEWIDLYAINEVEGFTEVPSIEFIKKNINLIIDTKNFSKDFKERLLSTIEDLDDNTNGLLINGDNFHAERLLLNKYESSISAIYIDPPYNTNSSKILYKNNYEFSSWNALMTDRIVLGRKMLQLDGFNLFTIDYQELFDLGKICDEIFDKNNRVGIVTIFINPKGRQHEKYFASSTEYMLAYKNSDNSSFNKVTIDSVKTDEFVYADDKGKYRLDDFRRMRTSTLRKNKPQGYYPIYVSKDLKEITREKKEGYYEVFPVNDTGDKEYTWKIIESKFDEYNISNPLVASIIDKRIQINNKYYEQQVFHNIWTDKKYQSEFNGTDVLKDILGKNLFPYPKSIFAVIDSLKIVSKENGYILDFFAGSGTTGHAVIELNRQNDNSSRKYILVEMGKYFDIVTKVRIKKVIYSNNWDEGKPENRTSGISHIMKYFNLESYEDSLSNIIINTGLFSLFSDNIEYMIDLDTKDSLLSLDKFKRPFDYKMKITSKNETKETNVDMVETFNYLIGLTVKRQYATRYFNTSEITDSPYKGAISLKEVSFNEENNDTIRFKEIYGILRDGRRATIIWRDISDNIENSNAALDTFFLNFMNSKEFDVLFINGDNNVQNFKKETENWNMEMIEPIFNELMFEEE